MAKLPTKSLALLLRVALAGAVLSLTACLGDGESNSPAGTSTSISAAVTILSLPPVPSPTPILPPSPVGSFADSLNSPGVLTTITTNTTGIANGDVVQITGSAGGAYDGVTPGAYDGVFVVSFKGATSFDIPAKFTAAGGAAAFQVIAAGSGPIGSTCPAVATAIQPNVYATRYSGVAPLAVFFDATGTTHTDASKNPFHDLEYQWDFDFNNAEGLGNWSTGSRVSARKIAQGPVAAHVYEKPGIYWVKVTIKDGNPANNVTDDCIQIAVLHPDIVYSGTKTVCVDDVGVPGAGCPAGALPVTNADFCAAVTTHIGQGKRVLFNGAKTFSCAGGTTVSANGPWTIGTYPVVFGGGGKAKISTNQAAGGVIGVGAGPGIFPTDGRIMNLEITGSVPAPNPVASIAGVGNMDQLTLLRLNIHDIGDGPAFIINNANKPGNTHIWDQLAIVENAIQSISGGGGRHGVYAFASRFMLLGNQINTMTNGTEHLVRLDYLGSAAITNNSLTNGPADKETIAIRGTEQNSAGSTYAQYVLPFSSPTNKVVVADNELTVDSAYGLNVGPANDTIVVRVQDVISERNFYRAVPGITACSGGVCANAAVRTKANGHSIRNEIVNFDNFKFCNLIQAGSASTGMPAANNIRVYNNSAFSATTACGAGVFADLQAGVSNIKIKNNLAYLPSAAAGVSPAFCAGGCGAHDITNNTSTFAGFTTDPTFANNNAPLLGVGDWKPGTAVVGTTVPVFSDFYLIARPTPQNLGAVKAP